MVEVESFSLGLGGNDRFGRGASLDFSLIKVVRGQGDERSNGDCAHGHARCASCRQASAAIERRYSSGSLAPQRGKLAASGGNRHPGHFFLGPG